MLRHTLAAAVCTLAAIAAQAQTRQVDIPAGDLKKALDAYAAQSGVQLLYSADDVKGLSTQGARGPLSQDQALAALLARTGLTVRRDTAGAVAIFRGSAADAPAAGADDNALTTVTVTAQKRSQSAQNVPISMTTLTAKTLDTQRVQNLQDVARLTPGLLVSAFSEANPTIAIRGISNTFSQIGVSKPVAVVVDDVFIPRNSAASFQLFDLDSINVLKGPQGTLFGRNVTGGAIVINTRQPSFDAREVETEVTGGNLNDRQFNGLVNAPINDAAAFKFSTTLQDRDGYGVDRLTGRQEDDIHSRNYRAQLRLKPSGELDVLLSADYSEDWNGGRTLSSDTLGSDGNVRTSELVVKQDFSRTIGGMSAKVNWRPAAGEITSITAYRKSQAAEDYSGVAANYTLLATGSQSVVSDYDQVGTFSQELRYASPKWAGGDFVTGLYYSSEDGSRQLGTQGLAARTGALTTNTLAGQQVLTRSYAVFADGVVHLPADVDFTAGVRHTRDEKTATLDYTNFLAPNGSFSADDIKASWSQTTPRAVLSWKPSRDMMAYASVTRGFTAGGFNADASTLSAFTAPFAPETVTSYELGLKTQWLDNRLRINGAMYKMKYKDKQEMVFNSRTSILSIINAGRATVAGAELEAAYKPVNWLDLSSTYSRLNSRYDQFVVGTVNNTGNPMSNAPPKQFSAAASINIPIGTGLAGYLIGAASYSWIDSYNTGAANDPNLQIHSYSLANLNLGLESSDRRYRLTAWVKNLSNTTYILTRSTQVIRGEYAGEPRTFGLTLSAKF
ncbi:MAG: TonB-dependent receptor [Massilia sp.]|nr:TonB-dependent receptor [Massilia sp.]